MTTRSSPILVLSSSNSARAAADQLAALLDRRDTLQNYTGFSSNARYHILDILHDASEHNGLYDSYVKEDVDRLQYQYDLKYWPILSEVVLAIGDDAQRAEVTATDPATAAATESPKSGHSDFVRAFLARLDDSRVRECGFIPNDFALSDSAMASLVNCGPDLPFDELVDADFIKRFRQRAPSEESLIASGAAQHFTGGATN